MTTQLALSDQERELILELLETERRELPSEIRRTDTVRVHDDLEIRLKLVDALIERLRTQPVH